MNRKDEIKKKFKEKIKFEIEDAEEAYNEIMQLVGHNTEMASFYKGKLIAFEDMLTILKVI